MPDSFVPRRSLSSARIRRKTMIESSQSDRNLQGIALPSYESKMIKESPKSLLDPEDSFVPRRSLSSARIRRKTMIESSQSDRNLQGISLPSYESKMIKESPKSLLDPEASIFGDMQDASYPQRPLHSPSLPASFRVTEKEGQQEKSLLLELLKTYSIRDKTDVFFPNVFALEMLPQEGFILIDRNNQKLKKLDKDFKSVSVYDLSETPWDVCYIGEGKVAVSLGRSGILFADVSGCIKKEKVVSLHLFCGGIGFFGDTLYIGDDEGSIFTDTFGDEKPRLLYQGYHTNIFCRRLAVSQSGEKIYIPCVSGITTINANGRQLATLQYDESSILSDICVIDDGTILVCDLHSNIVIQIDSEGTKVLRTFTIQNIGAYTICYDRQESRLIVGGLVSDVHVYKLPKM